MAYEEGGIFNRSFENVFGGSYANTIEEFVSEAVKVYTDESYSTEKVKIGRETIEHRLHFLKNERIATQTINDYMTKFQERRSKNLMQSMLWSETLRSTEKFSRSIHEKRQKSKK
eukprot:TRINITY_DN6896_c0_g1_i1.p1 TRINITY_DN6896_c0_g1~~TRINITY_DN6896_c0_g1_i1.p1  ORF type:complete len:115 (-),score=23.32 TRINITY_DN6896_c0_g1_i1:27-371(-)